MTKPEPRVNPDAQPWARDVDSDRDALWTELEELRTLIGRVSVGDGSSSETVSKILYELRMLYQATGITYPPVPPAPPAGTPEEPIFVPTYQTSEFGADWSRTWGSSSYYTGGGEYTDAAMLYQGSNPENKVGMFHFPYLENIQGRYITNAALWLQNQNAPWSYYFTAHLGTHSYDSPPVGKPGRTNGFDVGWARGEGKWHPLPDWVLAGLSNGTIKGFTVGASGASDTDSAYFHGVGKASPPRLSVTFQNN